MSADVSVLRNDLPNATILDAIRGAASTDYVNRIPSADKAGVQATVAALMDPTNRRWQNEFIDALVNRIGVTIARSSVWDNPLKPFKRGLLEFGNTIQEIQVGLLEAHGWSPDRDYMEAMLFGRETPEVQANYHTINRQDMYRITVNDSMLKRAFIDPHGLSSFVAQMMQAPANSDNLDEFLLTCSLFREYEANGGYHHIAVGDVRDYGSNGDDARHALRKMRATADNLKFLSTKYNAASMPVFAKPEDLVIFTTPEFNAAVDVEALAGAFNIERAQMSGRTITLPQEQFGIDGCQAILTTADFFVMADTLFESTSQYNAASLSNNYFLHHHSIISCSRFAPAVMFHTSQDDEVIVVRTAPVSVAAITIGPDSDGSTPTGIYHGGVVQLLSSVVPSGANQGLRWSVSGGGVGTFITNDGVLHLGASDPLTIGGHVTVRATATDVDPSLPYAARVFATLNVNVLDAPVIVWPVQDGVITDLVVQGVSVTPAFVPGTLAYTVTVPGLTVEVSDILVESDGPVSADVSLSDDGSDGTAVATIDTITGSGDAIVTYTVTITTAS